MKRISIPFIVLSITLAFCTHDLHAGWSLMNMPGASTVRAFVQSGGNLFAASQGGGVFLSTDNGASWAPRNSGLGNMNVYSLAFQSTTLYAGTGRGVYVSTNNGTSWESRVAGLPVDTAVNAIIANGNTVIAGTNGGFAFLSTDGGMNWTKDTSMHTNTVNTFVMQGSSIFAAANGGVYQTTDNGISWKRDTAMTAYTICSDNNILYDGGYGYIAVSTDNGATWTKDTAGMKNQYVYALWVSGNNMFAGVINGAILHSTDGGATWSSDTNGIPTTYDTYAFIQSGNTFFVGDYNGIYQTTNNGASWSTAENGMTNPIVVSVCVNPNNGNILAATSNNVTVSTDNGTSWTNLSNLPVLPCLRAGYTEQFNIFIRMAGSTIFVGTSTGLYSSTDNGATWMVDTAGLSTYTARYCENFIIHDGKLFLSTYGSGIFSSTNNGASWQAANTGLTNFFVYGLAQIGTSLYAGSDGGFSVSTDDGASWTTIDSGVTDKYNNRLAALGNTLFAGMSGNPYRLYISTNAGVSWTTDSAFPFKQYVDAFAIFNGYVLAATELNGVYLSTDVGVSWTPVNEGLTTLDFNDLTVSGNYVFAATNTSVWRRTIPDFTNKSAVASVSPDSLFFVAQAGTTYDTITILNSGNATLIIDSVQTTDAALTFSYQDSATAGNSIMFIVACSDTVTTNHVEHIGLYTNAPDQPFILVKVQIQGAVSKVPAISFSSDSIFFLASVIAKSDTVIIKNTGKATLRIDSIHVTDNSFAYALVDSIAPGDSTQFIVIDLDTTMVSKTVFVIVYSNDPAHPIDTIKVTIQGALSVADGAIPTALWLSQNYPNPFSAITTISYSLYQDGNIRLSVFDPLGEQMATLASGPQSAGVHSVPFNASGLQNGVYFYRLTTGKYSLMGTMTVVK